MDLNDLIWSTKALYWDTNTQVVLDLDCVANAVSYQSNWATSKSPPAGQKTVGRVA